MLISVRSVVNMNSKLLSGDDADRHVRQTRRGNTGGRDERERVGVGVEVAKGLLALQWGNLP